MIFLVWVGVGGGKRGGGGGLDVCVYTVLVLLLMLKVFSGGRLSMVLSKVGYLQWLGVITYNPIMFDSL